LLDVGRIPAKELTMSDKLKALVVHGDPKDTLPVATMLQDNAFDVEHAPHGPAAFAALLRSRFDLVVTDIKLKRLDGFHVIEAVKGLNFPAKIIAFSGRVGKAGARGLLDVARAVGAHATLERPHKPSQLWHLLRTLFPQNVRDRRKEPREPS